MFTVYGDVPHSPRPNLKHNRQALVAEHTNEQTARVDQRPGHVCAKFGELHFEANTFTRQTKLTLTERVDGFDVKVDTAPGLHKMVKLYAKPDGNRRKLRGANSRPFTPDIETINGEEWFVIRMRFDEIFSQSNAGDVEAQALSGFVILSN